MGKIDPGQQELPAMTVFSSENVLTKRDEELAGTCGTTSGGEGKPRAILMQDDDKSK
jgi:hypothetical protein